MAEPKPITLPTGNEPRHSGPFTMFDDSFKMEFLHPPAHLDASFLMKITYFHKSPLMKLGKEHPQAPPLHIHLSQAESFNVLSGRVATTTTWQLTDTIHTPATTTQLGKAYVIQPYVPHRFWPVPPDHPGGAEFKDEDLVVLIWGHPTHPLPSSSSSSSSYFSSSASNHSSSNASDRNPVDLDPLFFTNLISLVDDLYAKRVTMTPARLGALMTMVHRSDAANVMWPTAWWLGSLRWLVPWYIDGVVSWVTQRLFGVRADGLMREYTSQEDWELLNRVEGESKKTS